MSNTKSIDLEASSSQYLSASDSASLDFTTSFSIMGWFKADVAIPVSGFYTLASKFSASGDAQRSFWFFYWNNAGTKQLSLDVSNDDIILVF